MSQAEIPIGDRLDALRGAVEVAQPYLPAPDVASARETIDRAESRLRHGTHHTVIAMAGPTGAGKSTLFNALVGEDVSTIGVRRPTTSEAHAAIFGAENADALLAWLKITRRHHVATVAEFEGLVLIDLPDHDSTQEANRHEVDRLVELVDAMIWVVDPQKYADESLHVGYLQPLADHAPVLRFVLSKVDTLSPSDEVACLADFEQLLHSDGIRDPEIHPVAVAPGDGPANRQADLGGVPAMIAKMVAERRSAVARVEVDIAAAASRLSRDEGSVHPASAKPAEPSRALIGSLGRAAGVEVAADAAAAQYRRDASLATGWPATRWLGRFRRKPIRAAHATMASAVAEAELNVALRTVADEMSATLPEPWPGIMRRRSAALAPATLAALNHAVKTAVMPAPRRPRWWLFASFLQRVSLAVAAVGLVWLVALAVIEGLIRFEINAAAPKIGEFPLPTLLLLGGAGTGLLLAWLARMVARVISSRVAAGVRRSLHAQISDVARTKVSEPLLVVRRDFDDIDALCARARGLPLRR